jgi:uncharacterized protein (UPF0332 family)
MAHRLLEAAEILAEKGMRSRTFRWRAVSTAYYAVFHALAKKTADYVTRSAQRSTEEYQRVYRSLDHGTLKTVFSQRQMKESRRLSSIGATVVQLQAERHNADYLPPVANVFSRDDVQRLLDMARQTVAEIEAIRPAQNDCRLLTTYLLFKNKRGGT